MTIEDYLPLAESFYPEAVARYSAKLINDYRSDADADELNVVRDRVRASFEENFGSHPISGIAAWGQKVCQELSGLSKPSKVGIAREYVALLDERRCEEWEGAALDRADELMRLRNYLR